VPSVSANHVMHTSFMEKPMTHGRTGSEGSEAGFSLVEVLVAMTITLIISGAIYGLLASGQGAFRREPELTDRQQNARIALNLIMRDISNAGAVGTTPYQMIFGTTGNACALCPFGPDLATRTDELQILTNNAAREMEPVCTDGTTPNSTNIQLIRPLTVTVGTPVVVLYAGDLWSLRTVTAATAVTTGAPANCSNAASAGGSPSPGHTQLTFANGDALGLNPADGACNVSPGTIPWGTPSSTTPCRIVGISFANVVRYRVRNDASAVPVLQRWSSDAPSAFVAGVPADAAYETVARGIEDLQLRYHRVGAAATAWDNVPWPIPSTVPSPTDVTDQVEVVLVARSEARQLQGARQASPSGRINVRGTLRSVGAPRTTLLLLANVTSSPSPSARPWF
jgi:type IV pilus assembly protein PilW